MNEREALIKKADEVFDLYSRGLLTLFYKNAWEDVMSILGRYEEVRPINLLANDNNAVARLSADHRGIWQAAIRYKIQGANAEIVNADTYEELEFKVREYFKRNGEKGWIAPFINKPLPTANNEDKGGVK